MKPSALIWLGVLAVLAAGLLVGIGEVLRLRLDLSGAFPEYSTYRADGMGAQALYRALGQLPDLHVERNERSIDLFHGDPHTALLLLGVHESPDPYKLIQKLEEFVANGGRLVITYGIRGRGNFYCLKEEDAEDYRQEHGSAETRIKDWIKREGVPAVKPPRRAPWDTPGTTLASERWGFRVVQPMDADEFQDGPPLQAKPSLGQSLGDPVSWKSPEYFLPQRDDWETIYSTEEDRPVLMRRAFGKGEFIVASDSFFISNESMRAERHADLVAWLIGDKQRVVFDENTKGIDRSPGIVGLMKRYHLHIVIVMTLLLAVLYIWRGSVPLLPRRNAEQERERAVLLLGRDAHAGLAALLRRAAPPAEILRVCHDEWNAALGKNTTAPPTATMEARRILTAQHGAGEAEIIERYRAAAALLRERRSS